MEKKCLNKKGTHVGLMISFLIFITFLVFLYTLIQPQIQNKGSKKTILDYVKTKMISDCTVQFTITSVKVNKSSRDVTEMSKNCFEIKEIIKNKKFIVKNETDSNINATTKAQNILIRSNESNEEFFRIYYSDFLLEDKDPSLNQCWDPDSDEYWIGLTKEVGYFFEDDILYFFYRYENNYESLKQDLNIPLGTEFSFSFTYQNGSVIKTAEKEIKTDVYAEEIPLQYINKKADVGSGFLTVKVW